MLHDASSRHARKGGLVKGQVLASRLVGVLVGFPLVDSSEIVGCSGGTRMSRPTVACGYTTTARNLDYDGALMLRETATQQKKGCQSIGLKEERLWGSRNEQVGHDSSNMTRSETHQRQFSIWWGILRL